jgi:hypothetical protein
MILHTHTHTHTHCFQTTQQGGVSYILANTHETAHNHPTPLLLPRQERERARVNDQCDPICAHVSSLSLFSLSLSLCLSLSCPVYGNRVKDTTVFGNNLHKPTRAFITPHYTPCIHVSNNKAAHTTRRVPKEATVPQTERQGFGATRITCTHTHTHTHTHTQTTSPTHWEYTYQECCVRALLTPHTTQPTYQNVIFVAKSGYLTRTPRFKK